MASGKFMAAVSLSRIEGFESVLLLADSLGHLCHSQNQL